MNGVDKMAMENVESTSESGFAVAVSVGLSKI